MSTGDLAGLSGSSSSRRLNPILEFVTAMDFRT
jgi:hypothetical protein